jgi:L-alanine-DL-glutamate epimerase-like enolase superfamily enzyme
MGRGGTLTHAISGIDIALWDILGKALGQPVGRLLGGIYRTRVKPYCSLLMEDTARRRNIVAISSSSSAGAPMSTACSSIPSDLTATVSCPCPMDQALE